MLFRSPCVSRKSRSKLKPALHHQSRERFPGKRTSSIATELDCYANGTTSGGHFVLTHNSCADDDGNAQTWESELDFNF